jgi:hypothetical protein
MRDGRTGHSEYPIHYSMRAQIFYTTGIKAVEDPASSFYSERNDADIQSNRVVLGSALPRPR